MIDLKCYSAWFQVGDKVMHQRFLLPETDILTDYTDPDHVHECHQHMSAPQGFGWQYASVLIAVLIKEPVAWTGTYLRG